MTSRIRLLTLWSGPLPRYMPLFLMTAGRNPEFEFVFVADSPAPEHLLDGGLPDNVLWVERTHEEVTKRLGTRLGVPTDGLAPYKLCDFKPTFGYTFDDLVGDADFWGYIDCDIILGRLAHVLTDDLLSQYDVLGMRGLGYAHGPLTLYRNSDATNLLFTEAHGWRTSLAISRTVGFDEAGGWWAWKGETRPSEARDSMTDVLRRAVREGRVSVYDEDHLSEADPRTDSFEISWTDGVLTDHDAGREIAYYHLIHAKKTPFFRTPTWHRLPDTFHVGPHGIRADGEPSVAVHLNRLSRGSIPYTRSFVSRAAAWTRRALRR